MRGREARWKLLLGEEFMVEDEEEKKVSGVCVCVRVRAAFGGFKDFFFFLFPVDGEMNADEEAPSERAEEKSVRSCYQG
jgi:hypothetical protein